MDHRREDNAEGAEPLTQAGKISRRTMVVGTVATTAMAAVLPLANSAFAQAPDPNTDMLAFLLLSEALTGVDKLTLAPELSGSNPGFDPINIKDAYFTWITGHAVSSTFRNLLQIAKDNGASPIDIITKVNGSDDKTKFLARSIVLLWYLGSWYKPDDLQANAAPGRRQSVSSKVVSAKAYTQGLVWLIAGAHPMGYSNLQFGYWSRDPHDQNGPNGTPLPLFSPSQS
jgi:Membrane bound FAD containing D-sorbitol dehydrogenase